MVGQGDDGRSRLSLWNAASAKNHRAAGPDEFGGTPRGMCCQPRVTPKIGLHQKRALGYLGLDPQGKDPTALIWCDQGLHQIGKGRHLFCRALGCRAIDQPLMLHQGRKPSGTRGELHKLIICRGKRRRHFPGLNRQGQGHRNKKSFQSAHKDSMSRNLSPIN